MKHVLEKSSTEVLKKRKKKDQLKSSISEESNTSCIQTEKEKTSTKKK